MTKEVTKTTVRVARIDVTDGEPKAVELEPIILLGNVDAERAQKAVTKQVGAGAQVLSVEADTQVYELPVTEFLKIAKLKVAADSEQESEEETEQVTNA